MLDPKDIAHSFFAQMFGQPQSPVGGFGAGPAPMSFGAGAGTPPTSVEQTQSAPQPAPNPFASILQSMTGAAKGVNRGAQAIGTAIPAASTATMMAGGLPAALAMLAGQGNQAPTTPADSTPGALLKRIQENRDPVGQYDNRSNLPSDAPSSLSPFATGFFKPRPVKPSTNP